MRLRISIVLGALLALLMTLPIASASFTDATSNDGNTFRARQPIRVTTYQIGTSVFTGTQYDLQLDQALSDDYFIVMRGGAWETGISRQGGYASTDYARVTGDPHGNLGVTTAADVLRLHRQTVDAPLNPTTSWQGQITVVESLDSQDTAGFRLRDVATVTFNGTATDASVTIAPGWTDGSQVGLYGGVYGGGVETTAHNASRHPAAWSRLWPSGSNTINLERRSRNLNNLNGVTTFTIYAIEWGSQWQIQRVLVDGTNGGNGVNTPNEYTTAGISRVARDNTFILAFGNTHERGLGNGWEGQVFTLGNGVQQRASENRVAVGAETSGSRRADVYVHTHPQLHVDYRFMPDGSIGQNATSGSATVDPSLGPETRSGGSIGISGELRFAILSNGSNGTGNWYPRPMVWARHTGDSQVTWYRSRSGQPGVYWLQSVDFGEIWR